MDKEKYIGILYNAVQYHTLAESTFDNKKCVKLCVYYKKQKFETVPISPSFRAIWY